MLIANNIINYRLSGNSSSRDLIIANNIILSYLEAFGFGTSSILITNNIFVGGYNLGYFDIKKVIFTNNIFYGVSIRAYAYPTNFYFSYTIWNSNISIGGGSYTAFPLTGSNTGSNNHEDVDPMFVSAAGYVFHYTDDYHLQPGSPGIAAGTDGTNIGIYGGPFPFPDGGISGGGYQTSQETPIPQIYEMNVLNSALPVNGDLHIDVKAHSQN